MLEVEKKERANSVKSSIVFRVLKRMNGQRKALPELLSEPKMLAICHDIHLFMTNSLNARIL